MGQGLANKRLAQPLSKPEAMLDHFPDGEKKPHRVEKRTITE